MTIKNILESWNCELPSSREYLISNQIIKYYNKLSSTNLSNLYNIDKIFNNFSWYIDESKGTIYNINLIKKWIAEGAKNSNCIPINCDTSNVLYSNEIAPIINTYCKGCHNTGNKGGNVNLDNFADVKASTLTGKLLFTINASAYTLMPKGGPKLSNCNLRKIQIWADKNCPQ